MAKKISKPVIFLTFANATGQGYLQQLKKESALLRDLFLPLHQSEQLELLREESLENWDLPKLLNHYKNQILIFHYGGHANGEYLAFEDGKGNVDGLAELLSLQTYLKLVFLNGCSTQKQATPYLEAGIQVVLATTKDILDEDATYFAEHFYHALINRHTIREAFKSASGALRVRSLKYKKIKEDEVVIYRGAGFQVNKSEVPWKLYIQEGKEAALDWSLVETTRISKKKITLSEYISKISLWKKIGGLIFIVSTIVLGGIFLTKKTYIPPITTSKETTIRGTVYDSERERMEGAILEFDSELFDTTDSKGHFKITTHKELNSEMELFILYRKKEYKCYILVSEKPKPIYLDQCNLK